MHDHDHDHAVHDHDHAEHHRAGQLDRAGEIRALRNGLALLLAFMTLEVLVAIFSHSLALLSDAAHMLTDAAALAMSLLASRLTLRPARGRMTFGLGRVEIVSAGANGMTLLVLGLVVCYGAVAHLITPRHVSAAPVLAVALVGIVVNIGLARILHTGADHHHTLNLAGSYRHIVTDLLGFVATAIAAGVILATGFERADAIASLVIAGVMLHSGYRLSQQSLRVVMEAAPEGLEPAQVGHTLASCPGVVEVHDLHIWEVTSGFPALSAHVLVSAECDCHAVRAALATLLVERFGLAHSTLQIEHAQPPQPPLQIELAAGQTSAQLLGQSASAGETRW